ncbi:restriction endonuclease subunit S [Pseudomonas sp.]|uniref:restriction endonuclease subunit S n=1 Tax=Pseudomonas sp. TaxID=306 RepID=UPI002635E6DF|nr:restriction endonuclease subunit S [Pseudomonas sp.]
MTTLLTDNLPLLVGTPNGIMKLRELILGLAVRGKLVQQDPNDEPASELLKRIDEDTTRSVAGGRSRKQSTFPSIDESEKAFELPNGWEWVRLQQIISVSSGDGLVSANMKPIGGIPVYGGNGITGYHDEKNVNKETLVIGRVGYYCGSIHLTPANAWITDNALIVSFSEENFYKNFFFWLLKGTNLKEQENATAQPVISGRKIYPIVLAIPPLAEQHRIVAKVDELMTLCDRLEARQAGAESAHTQLVQALLDSLTQTTDSNDFAVNWQRLAEHLHSLFRTESSIDALKQTLLQLAVMGKLVSQPDDTHADSTSAINQRPDALPKGWRWCKFGSTWESSFYGPRFGKEEYVASGGIPTIRTTDMSSGGLIEMRDPPQVHVPTKKLDLYKLKSGDLLVTRSGSIGTMALFLQDTLAIPSAYLIRIRFLPTITPQFGLLYLKSPLGQSLLGLNTTSVGVPNVSATKMALFSLPLPPIDEQRRIVAKVDQLMAQCDQLKTSLTQARQLNEQLASTLVERALTDDGQQAPIATDRQVSRTLLAAEITHQLHSQRTFGQRKLQKVIYLAEHAARLAVIQGDYLRDAAGPHDRRLMNKVEGEMQNHQWYERIERETVGHAYLPLSQAGQHRKAYSSAWSVAERATIEQVIELMRDWDTDRCEMTVTLYAAWNDFILEGRPVSDDAIVDEVMHSWNDTKLRFGKIEWLAVLAEMKKHKILMPTGFGKRTTGGMLSLPGFE